MACLDRYNKALEYTRTKHEGQYRKGGEPYITHPQAVAEILREKGYGEDYLIAGLFHDLLAVSYTHLTLPTKRAV